MQLLKFPTALHYNTSAAHTTLPSHKRQSNFFERNEPSREDREKYVGACSERDERGVQAYED